MTEFSAIDLSEEEGMQWTAVESSQISEIGYESGAEYPLGIKFPPNKKQTAAGLPGSEYRYKNVSPELHAQLLAAKDNPVYNNSIGTFFGKVIKGYADLYPYVKVESDPILPAASPVNSASTKTKPNGNGTKSMESMDGEIISPSTALTIIDTMADDLLFSPGAVTDAQLAAGRDWYLTEAKKYDISTEKSRTELKRFARPLQKLRTGIEARAKELTGATKRKIAAIDAEKRRLVMLVGGIEQEVLAPLTAWEQEEDARVQRLAGEVKRIGEMGQPYLYTTVDSLIVAIAQLNAFDLSTMQEFKVSAESAVAASLRSLTAELVKRQEAEAAQAELAKLRAEAAERAEKDRLAEVAKQAVEAARATIREEVIAELQANPEEVKPFVYLEVPQPSIIAPNKRERAMQEAQVGLSDHCDLSVIQTRSVVEAIAKGLIPYITITY